MPLLSRKYHRTIFTGSLALMAASLPLSEFILSIAIIICSVNWIAEGQYGEKWQQLKTRKSLWFVMVIYLVHLAGMLYTKDTDYGLHDLRIKLPLLILPLVVGTTGTLSGKEANCVFMSFILGVIVSSIAGFAAHAGLIPQTDGRASIFISHIRLALMVNMAIVLCLNMTISQFGANKWFSGSLYATGMIWLVFFIFILKSLTGILILLILTLLISIYILIKLKNVILKFILVTFLATVVLLSFSFVTHSIIRYYRVVEVDLSALETHTKRGNPYIHDLVNQQIENGNYVWLYLCEEELKEGWEQMSDVPYDGVDGRGQYIRYTLIRYLTSKGLRKDAEGLAQLQQEDVEAVESGLANCLFLDRYSLYPKMYEVIWQIDQFRKGGNPSGNSVTQRIEYLKTAINIFRNHVLMGVGTGDVSNAFDEQYTADKSGIDPAWRLRAHNQYITFLLTFGIIGFLLIAGSFIMIIYLERKNLDPLALAFLLIALLSMINEDTLETHAGVSFIAFFFSVLLWGRKEEGKQRKNGNGA